MMTDRCHCGREFVDSFKMFAHVENECGDPVAVMEYVSCWRGFNYMPVKMRKAIMRAIPVVREHGADDAEFGAKP